jgi:hypothetical protein
MRPRDTAADAQMLEVDGLTSVAQQPTSNSTSTVPRNDATQHDGRIGRRRLLQRKLLLTVTIPTAIGLIQLAFATYAIVKGNARPLVLLFLLPALLVGYWFGKRVKIAWDDTSAQVSLIQAQVLLTVSYIVVRIGTHFLLEKTLSSRIHGLAVALLLVSFGLFFGRSLALSVQIWRALRGHTGPESTDAHSP